MISPFLDRRHGTERVIIEQLEKFSAYRDLEIHVYAQRLEDVAGVSRFSVPQKKESLSLIFWHKIPSIPGPHLVAYLWWFFANQFYRWRDARFRGLKYDLVYSPGINAWDADAIAVHIVFHEFYRRVSPNLNLRGIPIAGWPRRIHRRLYYKLIMYLEHKIYTRPETSLAVVSQLVSRHLAEFFQRSDAHVIPNAVDTGHFTAAIRSDRRTVARERLGMPPDVFVLLLIGNDWEKKGLNMLFRSMAECRDLPLKLLVVGQDDRSIFLPIVEQLGLQHRVEFHCSTGDVMHFYAAADLYVGPSLEDSFALPPLEAMACGLPVITSVNNGGSQAITDGVDGFVLSDPHDTAVLARLLRILYEQSDLRRRVGENAACTAQAYTWDRNASETWKFLMSALEKKNRGRVAKPQ